MAILSFHRLRLGLFRRFSGFSATFLAVAALVLAGCHHVVTDPHDPKFIVAEKSDWTITRAQLDAEVATFLKQRQATPEQVGPDKMLMLESAVLDNMVLQKLLLAKAATMDLKGVDTEEAKAMEQLKSQVPPGQDFDTQLKAAGLTMDELQKRLHERILIQKVLQAETAQGIEPTDQEINDFYMQHKDKFVIPSKTRASRIVILVDEKTSPADKAAKKKAIDAAHARVVKGEDFSKVAQAVSEDRYSAPRGGDIGYFQKGENEAPFDAVAFNTKVGTVSAVFETPMGYQFLKITDVHPGSELSVAEARVYIAKYLSQMKQEKQVEDYSRKLLTTSGVTFHIKRVDPAQQPGMNAAAAEGATPPAPASAPAPAPTDH